VLEAVDPAADPASTGKPEQVLGRFDEDGHLVPFVLAAMVEAVNGRANRRAQDRAVLDDLL